MFDLGVNAAAPEVLDVLEGEMRQAMVKEKQLALCVREILICLVKD